MARLEGVEKKKEGGALIGSSGVYFEGGGTLNKWLEVESRTEKMRTQQLQLEEEERQL